MKVSSAIVFAIIGSASASVLSTTNIATVLAGAKSQSSLTIPAAAMAAISKLGTGGANAATLSAADKAAISSCTDAGRANNTASKAGLGSGTGSAGNIAFVTNKITTHACESAGQQIALQTGGAAASDTDVNLLISNVGVLNANTDAADTIFLHTATFTRHLPSSTMGRHYKEIAEIAQGRRAAALPKEYLLPEEHLANLPRDVTGIPRSSKHFTPEELEIIETSAEGILQKIREKSWTSVEVTKAFSKAAVVAHQLTNCLTEILIPEALERAQFLDDHLTKTGEVIGPLHGLPISLKDCFVTPPHPSSIGMSYYANLPTKPEDETVLVSLLAKLGAVFYVKTAVPVAMMMMETVSNVWGETNGAYHTGTTSGGSSGGEGVLLAMRGSPLGIGTDIGGSIRIPSSFNALYGIKPTFGRFPIYGTKSGISGQDFIYSNNGPMSRSLSTLQLYCKAVLSSELSPWLYDPKCLPVPWRQNTIQPAGRKLRIGIISDNDGEISVHPPIVRGLALTKKALESAGHEVFEWTPHNHPAMVQEMNSSFYTLGGAAILELTREHDEPVFPSMKNYEKAYDKGEEGTLGPTKLREMITRRNAFQKEYLDQWTKTGEDGKGIMDAVIMPNSPWTAPRLGVTQTDIFCVNFTGVWNLLDYPACTFPVTFADQKLDPPRGSDWKPLNQKDAKLQADYDAEFYHGTPVTLQCVGRRLEDEKVLEMVDIIRDALQSANIA
ncbi:Acetamidase protein [Rutstroemia sp. NJR-2017a BBW]|nr:Acetamidase protein [Rutstroemia sp. NJR-2017a BBW]